MDNLKVVDNRRKSSMINKKKQIVRVLIEALLAVLFAVLVEVGLTGIRLQTDIVRLRLTENTTTAKES